MRRVAIVGVGLTAFDKIDDIPVEDFANGRRRCAADADARREDIEAVFVSHLYQGEVLGQRILRGLRFPEVAIVNVENACAGGSTALARPISPWQPNSTTACSSSAPRRWDAARQLRRGGHGALAWQHRAGAIRVGGATPHARVRNSDRGVRPHRREEPSSREP